MIREPRSFLSRNALLVAAALLAVALLASRQLQHRAAPAAGDPEGPAARPAPAAPSSATAVRADWPAGPTREGATVGYALLSADRALRSKAPSLIRGLTRRHLPGFRVAQAVKGKAMPPPPSLVFQVVPAQPFEPRQLEYSGRDLDEAAKRRLGRGLPAVFLMVSAPPEMATRALRGTVALVSDAARSLHAYVDDPEARLTYSTRAFAREVAQGGFEGEVPVVAAHVNVHTYEPGGGDGLLRSVTLGMSKLGLPDVVVNGHPRGDGASEVMLIRAVCQRLEDDPVIAREGRLPLDLNGLRSARAKDPVLKTLRAGATARADLTIARGTRQEGDAENRLLELTFGGPPGGPTERQQAVLAGLLGVEDRVTRVPKDDPEMLAARARARAELLALKEGFQKGLPLGSQLLVKAPFERGRDREYMWVELTAWKGRTLRGILQNVPEIATDLRQGAPVEVDEDGAYDYLLRKPDGTEVGNHTGQVLARREKGR
jgi:uncharacterized protein YegJ (DUF2314 family)